MSHLVIKVAEYAVILNEANQFLMIQFGEDKGNKWHFPGGRLDKGDDSIDGLRREVEEETGLEIEVIKPLYTKVFDENDPKYGVFFLARCPSDANVKLSHEHVKYRWFGKDEIDNIDFWQRFYGEILRRVFEIK